MRAGLGRDSSTLLQEARVRSLHWAGKLYFQDGSLTRPVRAVHRLERPRLAARELRSQSPGRSCHVSYDLALSQNVPCTTSYRTIHYPEAGRLLLLPSVGMARPKTDLLLQRRSLHKKDAQSRAQSRVPA